MNKEHLTTASAGWIAILSIRRDSQRRGIDDREGRDLGEIGGVPGDQMRLTDQRSRSNKCIGRFHVSLAPDPDRSRSSHSARASRSNARPSTFSFMLPSTLATMAQSDL